MTVWAHRTDSVGRDQNTRWYALGEAEEGNGLRAAAHVDLMHEREHNNFFAGQPVTATRHGDPEELFTNTSGRVVGAFSDPTMRAHIPTLLGMAAAQNMRETGGRLPIPDKSLSTHSSALVKGLRARGIDVPENPENPGASANNALKSKEYNVTDYDVGNAKFTPPAQVESGRQLMRSMLRRPPVSGGQFGQSAPVQGKLF